MTTITTVTRFQSADFGSPKLGESMLSLRHVALLVIISGIVGYTLRYLLEKHNQQSTGSSQPLLIKRTELIDKISTPIRQLGDEIAKVFDQFKKKITKDQNLHFKVMHKYHALHDAIAFLTDAVKDSNHQELIQNWKTLLLYLQNTPIFSKNPSLNNTGLTFDSYYALEQLEGRKIEYVVEVLSNQNDSSTQQLREIEYESFLESPLNIENCVIARTTSTSLILGSLKYKKKTKGL